MDQQWSGTVDISYKTLTLHRAGLALPFNDWRPEHIRQGFSWRPESVSFRTVDPEVNTNRVEVSLRDQYTPPPAARRIIRVPFEVGEAGVEVTSPVSDAWAIALPPGHYALFFAVEPDMAERNAYQQAWYSHLTLVPASAPVKAAILRADEELSPPHSLLMEAEPAR
jgi:hypothetical protein